MIKYLFVIINNIIDKYLRFDNLILQYEVAQIIIFPKMYLIAIKTRVDYMNLLYSFRFIWIVSFNIELIM